MGPEIVAVSQIPAGRRGVAVLDDEAVGADDEQGPDDGKVPQGPAQGILESGIVGRKPRMALKAFDNALQGDVGGQHGALGMPVEQPGQGAQILGRAFETPMSLIQRDQRHRQDGQDAKQADDGRKKHLPDAVRSVVGPALAPCRIDHLRPASDPRPEMGWFAD